MRLTDNALINEFLAIQRRLADALRLGTYAGRREPFAVCQLLVMPSFENWIGWDVLHTVSQQSGLQTRLYRSCWRHDTDAAAFAKPLERARHPYPYLPTVEVGWVLVDSGCVEGLLARLGGITVPLGAPQEATTDDGTRFELAFGPHDANVRLAWHHELPPSWRLVQPLVNELLHLFEKAWAARTEPGIASDAIA